MRVYKSLTKLFPAFEQVESLRRAVGLRKYRVWATISGRRSTNNALGTRLGSAISIFLGLEVKPTFSFNDKPSSCKNRSPERRWDRRDFLTDCGWEAVQSLILSNLTVNVEIYKAKTRHANRSETRPGLRHPPVDS